MEKSAQDGRKNYSEYIKTITHKGEEVTITKPIYRHSNEIYYLIYLDNSIIKIITIYINKETHLITEDAKAIDHLNRILDLPKLTKKDFQLILSQFNQYLKYLSTI